MRLVHLFDGHVMVNKPISVGDGPYGRRLIFDVTGGNFTGRLLSGDILPSGGDWTLNGADNISRLDIRSTLKTNDGGIIYLQAFGIMVVNDKVKQAMASTMKIEYGDTYFMNQPRFETGDPRYAWLNAVVAVAELRFGPGSIDYRMFHVVH